MSAACDWSGWIAAGILAVFLVLLIVRFQLRSIAYELEIRRLISAYWRKPNP